MTRKPMTLVLAALAAAVGSAFAQETSPPFSGYVGITGISTHLKSDNAFRFEEYRDLDKGVTGTVSIRTESDAWWHRLFGENLGRDDQSIEVKGGKYGIFKYSIYDEDIIHNLTFGAITPFTGVGTNNLTFSGATASTDTTTWNRFDYSVKHRNIGGIAEAQVAAESPFYFRVSANRKESTGVKPLGAPGTSPGGPAYELPVPIDWTTTDWSGEIGYSTKKMHLSLTALMSKFEDNNDFLLWRSPVIASGANVERSTLAADNTLRRLGLNAIFKALPYDSTLAFRGTYTRTTNNPTIPTTFVALTGTAGSNALSGPSQATFNGEVVNQSFSAALNSNLTRDWSSKAYYNYYKRENKSSEIVFTPNNSAGTCDTTASGAALPTCTTEFLHFTKNNFGLELYYRLTRQNKLTFGADYLDTKRERVDFDRSKETKVFGEWKSGMLEVADFRVKYTHLERKADFLLGDNPDPFQSRFLRFDAAPLTRDVVKFAVDASPMPLLDLGAEVNFKQNKYDDTLLGRNKDTRQELSLSASYGDARVFRVTAFGDIEHTQYESTHWVGATTTFPNTNAAGTTYLWQSKVKDRNWLFGVAADWPFNERLKVVGSFIVQRGDGGVDFTAPAQANAQPITQYDDFKKRAFNLRAVYAATKEIQLALGAAYEKYDYSDIQMNDYIYAIRTGTNQSYLTGAYAFPAYKASIVYATLTYRFR